MRIRSHCCKAYFDRWDSQFHNATLCCDVCGLACDLAVVPEEEWCAGDEILDCLGPYVLQSGLREGLVVIKIPQSQHPTTDWKVSEADSPMRVKMATD